MDHFLALPLDGFKRLWTGLVAPATSLFNFDYVASSAWVARRSDLLILPTTND
jgi:hypothetical protein